MKGIDEMSLPDKPISFLLGSNGKVAAPHRDKLIYISLTSHFAAHQVPFMR